MARLPDPVIVKINVLSENISQFVDIEELRDKGDSLMADLIHKLATKKRQRGKLQ